MSTPISPETEARLVNEAKRLGISVDALVAHRVAAQVEMPYDHIENIGTLTGRRITRFLTTTPDEAHNRRRLLFTLLVFFAICILGTFAGYYFKATPDKDTAFGLIKDFTNTMIWLAGIYVGGTVAAMAVDKPKVTATSDIVGR